MFFALEINWKATVLECTSKQRTISEIEELNTSVLYDGLCFMYIYNAVATLIIVIGLTVGKFLAYFENRRK